jgi:hypothetical protein
MRKKLLGSLTFVVLTAAVMHAQASRTWVSGVGDDANPCSRTAPCKTFAGAISKTAAGGEIDALDPAGYGAVTITKAITIDGGGGQVASVLVSGTNGIVIQAGPSDVVILRNLRINGIGTGINGIRFLAGKTLILDNCDIFGFTTNGVDIAQNGNSKVVITNCFISSVGGDGVRATTTAGRVDVAIDNTFVDGATGVGIHAVDHSKIVATRTTAAHSGVGFRAESASADAEINLDHCTAIYNTASGVQSGPTGTGNIILSDTKISYNTPGFTVSTGTIFTFGNNRINSNFLNSVGTLTAATPGQQ